MSDRLYQIYKKKPNLKQLGVQPSWGRARQRLGLLYSQPEFRRYVRNLQNPSSSPNIDRERVKSFLGILDMAKQRNVDGNLNTMGGIYDIMQMMGYTDTDKLLTTVEPKNRREYQRYLNKIVNHYLIEAPVGTWDVDPNMDHNRNETNSRLKGYGREQDHWSEIDSRAINNPETKNRVNNAFSRIPQRVNLFFWQIPDPDYDPYLQKGIVDLEWIKKNMDEDLAKRVKQSEMENSISIILTNNLSDEKKISMQSPWMITHRIAHTMVGGATNREVGGKPYYTVTNEFNAFVRYVMEYGYDYKWHTHIPALYYEELDILKKELGHALDTMKSARTGNLVQGSEWMYESFVQYLIQGRVRFNTLPETLGGINKTKDPNKFYKAIRMVGKFPSRLESWYDKVLEDAVGRVFVG